VRGEGCSPKEDRKIVGNNWKSDPRRGKSKLRKKGLIHAYGKKKKSNRGGVMKQKIQ